MPESIKSKKSENDRKGWAKLKEKKKQKKGSDKLTKSADSVITCAQHEVTNKRSSEDDVNISKKKKKVKKSTKDNDAFPISIQTSDTMTENYVSIESDSRKQKIKEKKEAISAAHNDVSKNNREKKKKKEKHSDELNDHVASNSIQNSDKELEVQEQKIKKNKETGDNIEIDDSKKKEEKKKEKKDKVRVEVKIEENKIDKSGVTLLLFYAYVEPEWNAKEYEHALQWSKENAALHKITGRLRVAKEGFNGTMTGSYDDVRNWCQAMRNWNPKVLGETDFKLTDNLPIGQKFPALKVFPVTELVNYGLSDKQPSLKNGGIHLNAEDYHKKMEEPNTVIIDVRNSYEAAIGHFQPPPTGNIY